MMEKRDETPTASPENELTEDALEQISGGVSAPQQHPNKVIESIGVKYAVSDEAGTLKG